MDEAEAPLAPGVTTAHASGAGHAAPLRRSRGRDPLGLRRVLADRLLPALVAAMVLLGALALAGAAGAAALASRWQEGAAAAVTVQLPPGTAPARAAAAAAAITALPEVAEARLLDQARLAALLRPWIGDAEVAATPLPLPILIEIRLHSLSAEPEALSARIAAAAGPGAEVEAHGVWVARLVALARSLQAVALAALLVVAGLAAAVVAVAVRAGIAARREAIAILHGLGATDGDIAGRFAARIALLAGGGAVAGILLSIPVLALFADLAAPLLGRAPAASLLDLPLDRLPWAGLAVLAPLAAALGWLTAQATVRLWLRRLP